MSKKFGPKNMRALRRLAHKVRAGNGDPWANIDDEYSPEEGRGIKYKDGQVYWLTWSAYPPTTFEKVCEDRTEVFNGLMAELDREERACWACLLEPRNSSSAELLVDFSESPSLLPVRAGRVDEALRGELERLPLFIQGEQVTAMVAITLEELERVTGETVDQVRERWARVIQWSGN